MSTRYLLILSESEGIICIGHLPRVGELVRVSKEYHDYMGGPDKPVTYLVESVTYPMDVKDEPYDAKGSRGNEYGELPEVRVRGLV
jgi:hypothetical protein